MLINGFEFFEDSQEPPSPSYQFAGDSARIIRSLVVRDSTEDRRKKAAKALCGYNRVVTVAGKTYITRTMPHGYPAIADGDVGTDGTPYLYVGGIPRCEAVGKPTGLDEENRANYTAQRFEVHYQRFPYDHKSDSAVNGTLPGGPLFLLPDEGDALRSGWRFTRFISRNIDPASRVITLKQAVLHYVETVDTDRTAIPESMPFTQFRARVNYTWHLVPILALPRLAWKVCSNCVNDISFDGFSADTLLFSDAKVQQLSGPLGDRLCNVEYTFLWQPNVDSAGTEYGWKAIPRVKGGQFYYWEMTASGDPATKNNADQRPFKRADFTSLFRPDQ